jgi:hypothetical protein
MTLYCDFFGKEAKERKKLKRKTIHEKRRFPLHHSQEDRVRHLKEKHKSRSYNHTNLLLFCQGFLLFFICIYILSFGLMYM